MADSYVTNYFGNRILTYYMLTADNRYLGLFQAEPGVLGDQSNEMVGGDYARQLMRLSTPGSKTLGNMDRLLFDDLPAGTIRYFALCNSPSAGEVLWVVKLPTPLVVPVGHRLIIEPGDVAFTL